MPSCHHKTTHEIDNQMRVYEFPKKILQVVNERWLVPRLWRSMISRLTFLIFPSSTKPRNTKLRNQNHKEKPNGFELGKNRNHKRKRDKILNTLEKTKECSNPKIEREGGIYNPGQSRTREKAQGSNISESRFANRATKRSLIVAGTGQATKIDRSRAWEWNDRRWEKNRISNQKFIRK